MQAAAGTSATSTYIVTSYRDPEQVTRLVRVLRAGSPTARVVVSHDCKGSALDLTQLQRHGAEYRPTRFPIYWGDGSYLRSLLEVLGETAAGPSDWVTLLSAQDYPIRPLSLYESMLRTGEFDTILEEAPADHLLERYRRRAYSVPRWAARGSVARAVERVPGLSVQVQPHGLPPRVERPRLRTPFGRAGLTVYRGNDLYALNGRALDALLAAPASLLRYYDRCNIPSESYPHTVLRNAPGLRNEAQLLHYTRWAASAHPEWLGLADLPDMLQSAAWFARKFRPNDPVLDELDRCLSAD